MPPFSSKQKAASATNPNINETANERKPSMADLTKRRYQRTDQWAHSRLTCYFSRNRQQHLFVFVAAALRVIPAEDCATRRQSTDGYSI